MTIETKYDFGDTVYAVDRNSICIFKVKLIEIRLDEKGTVISYWDDGVQGTHKEEYVFDKISDAQNFISAFED